MNKQPIQKWIEQHNPQGLEMLAGLSKVPASTIKRLLSDTDRDPSGKTARKLSRVLGIDIGELFTEEEPSKNEPDITA